MNLNRKDLRKITYDFNCIANRLLRASMNEFLPVLKKFLGHIDSVELINEYVISCSREDFDINAAISEVNDSHGRRIFDLGYTDEEEIYTVYNLLLYISKNGFNYQGIGERIQAKILMTK